MTSTDGRPGSRADKLLADWADLAGRARRPTEAPTEPGISLRRTVVALSAPMAFAMVVAVLVGSLHPSEPASRMGVGADVMSPSPAPTLDGCLVTRPNGAHTSAWPASELDHGEGGLFTVLWPDGTVLVPVSEIDRDGIGWMKFVFQREGAAEGGLRLVGRRIGAPAGDPRGTIRSQIPDGYGTTGVQATAIGFPAEGCWEVIARSGASQLRFVMWVELGVVSLADLVGHPAPDVALTRLDGTAVDGFGNPGRPTIVTFWATWCPACAAEPVTLAGVARPDVDVVLVAVKDETDAVADALREHDLAVLLDAPGDAFARYGGFGLPLTVFIDGEGVIRSFVAGPVDEASMAAGLDRIRPAARFLPEPSGSPTTIGAHPPASPGS